MCIPLVSGNVQQLAFANVDSSNTGEIERHTGAPQTLAERMTQFRKDAVARMDTLVFGTADERQRAVDVFECDIQSLGAQAAAEGRPFTEEQLDAVHNRVAQLRIEAQAEDGRLAQSPAPSTLWQCVELLQAQGDESSEGHTDAQSVPSWTEPELKLLPDPGLD